MLEQFKEIELKFNDIERRMSDPEIIADQEKYQKIIKEHSSLKEGVELYRDLTKVISEINGANDLLTDPDMKEMAKEELAELTPKKEALELKLQLFLIPKDPDDEKGAIIEIRSGTGGEEAALFAGTLYRMYTKYAESNRWKVSLISQNITGLGGVKEVVFSVEGDQVFGRLKFESGTHRVQRVPDTETSGRIHTSAATVAILAEADEVDVDIDIKDCRVDTYRASGAGGQHVNKTDSAVRITHIPSGIVVACQDERSQFQNKDKAMRLLRSKLYEKQLEDSAKQAASDRKLQVGSGDRSQKIRTYNYPQGRVTDHRINLTLYELDTIIDGKIDGLIDELTKADQIEKMKK